MTATTVLTGKALTLKVGTVEYHAQTTNARVEAEPQTTSVEPLGVDPVEIATGVKRTLNLTVLQDWPEADSLMALLTNAFDAGTPVAFDLELTNAAGDTATATGKVQGAAGAFGGDASVLESDLALPVVEWDGITRVAGTP